MSQALPLRDRSLDLGLEATGFQGLFSNDEHLGHVCALSQVQGPQGPGNMGKVPLQPGRLALSKLNENRSGVKLPHKR